MQVNPQVAQLKKKEEDNMRNYGWSLLVVGIIGGVGLMQLSRGNYDWAIFDLVLFLMNIIMWRIERKVE